MKQKSLLLAFSVWLSFFSMTANNLLLIHQKSGGVVTISLTEKPVVTLSDETLMIFTDRTRVEYPYCDVEKFTFGQSESSIEMISHENPSETIQVFTIEGRLVDVFDAEDRAVRILLRELPSGTYIIKSGDKGYKVIIDR